MIEGQIPDYILKALEWTKEWSTWLVGIDTAIIGGLVALGVKEKSVSQPIQFHSRSLLAIAIYLFALSIGLATFTLGGIPHIVQKLTPDYIRTHIENFDVLKVHWDVWFFGSWDLEWVDTFQQLFFILGIFCVGINIRFKK